MNHLNRFRTSESFFWNQCEKPSEENEYFLPESSFTSHINANANKQPRTLAFILDTVYIVVLRSELKIKKYDY